MEEGRKIKMEESERREVSQVVDLELVVNRDAYTYSHALALIMLFE